MPLYPCQAIAWQEQYLKSEVSYCWRGNLISRAHQYLRGGFDSIDCITRSSQQQEWYFIATPGRHQSNVPRVLTIYQIYIWFVQRLGSIQSSPKLFCNLPQHSISWHNHLVAKLVSGATLARSSMIAVSFPLRWSSSKMSLHKASRDSPSSGSTAYTRH